VAAAVSISMLMKAAATQDDIVRNLSAFMFFFLFVLAAGCAPLTAL
jgi:hypothetical protein